MLLYTTGSTVCPYFEYYIYFWSIQLKRSWEKTKIILRKEVKLIRITGEYFK